MKETSTREQKTHAAHLRIGVRKDAGTLEAHAWLEYGGTPIGEQGDVAPRFAPLAAVGTN